MPSTASMSCDRSAERTARAVDLRAHFGPFLTRFASAARTPLTRSAENVLHRPALQYAGWRRLRRRSQGAHPAGTRPARPPRLDDRNHRPRRQHSRRHVPVARDRRSRHRRRLESTTRMSTTNSAFATLSERSVRILIRADVDKVPFDLLTDRYLVYDAKNPAATLPHFDRGHRGDARFREGRQPRLSAPAARAGVVAIGSRPPHRGARRPPRGGAPRGTRAARGRPRAACRRGDAAGVGEAGPEARR